MKDLVIMLIIVVIWAFSLLYKAEFVDTKNHLFDKYNTNAMRGFWCIIVIIGHTPALYVNRIQDLILCFGYIGITFFFMTSGYGLALGHDRKPEGIKTFWRKRLPKLVLACWFVDVVKNMVNFILYGTIPSIGSFFQINRWVLWLLVCYFCFWIAHILIKNNKLTSYLLVFVLVTAFSVTMYFLHSKGIYTATVWPVECFGFIYGMLLAWMFTKFYEYFNDKWFMKLAVVMAISVVLGLCYLKFKSVPFVGDYLIKIVLGFSLTLLILITNVRISYGNKINHFLGKISFEVYLIHPVSYELVVAVFGEKVSSGVFIGMSIIISLVLAYIAHIIINKIMTVVNGMIKC